MVFYFLLVFIIFSSRRGSDVTCWFSLREVWAGGGDRKVGFLIVIIKTLSRRINVICGFCYCYV